VIIPLFQWSAERARRSVWIVSGSAGMTGLQ
jgi:hypothetical protein